MLVKLIEEKRFIIRVYTKSRLHAKAYIFDYPTERYDRGMAIIGSSNLSLSGLVDNTELNVEVHGKGNHEQLTKWFFGVLDFPKLLNYHALSRANASLDGSLREERTDGALVVRTRPYAGLPELALHASPGAHLVRDGTWYYSNEYLAELDRGLDFREDLWKLGTLQLQLEPGKPAFVAASIGPRRFDATAVADLASNARTQRRSRSADPFLSRLDLAADQFVVRRADERPTVIAGYPWFTDWGRDTMISLPGLLLARGLLAEAREVLRGFLAHVDRGLIPNAFPDRPGDKPEYNTVDATLWMFQAVHAYVQASGDARFLREEFYPAAKEIVRWHRQGTHHGIKVDPADELLSAGIPGVQLTWMDARVGGRVITPRHGKPVEINSLWYNSLRLMALWGGALGDAGAATEFAASADRVHLHGSMRHAS